MPMAVGQSVTGLWLYGETMCKLTSYLQGKQFIPSDDDFLIKHSIIERVICRRQEYYTAKTDS